MKSNVWITVRAQVWVLGWASAAPEYQTLTGRSSCECTSASAWRAHCTTPSTSTSLDRRRTSVEPSPSAAHSARWRSDGTMMPSISSTCAAPISRRISSHLPNIRKVRESARNSSEGLPNRYRSCQCGYGISLTLRSQPHRCTAPRGDLGRYASAPYPRWRAPARAPSGKPPMTVGSWRGFLRARRRIACSVSPHACPHAMHRASSGPTESGRPPSCGAADLHYLPELTGTRRREGAPRTGRRRRRRARTWRTRRRSPAK